MQKLRITNTYNKENNQYEKGTFDIRESEKSITGKVNISTKKDDKYISKSLPFIAFKSKIDRETERAILDSRGQLFDAEIGLMVDNFQDQTGKTITYIKLVINQARFEAVDKHNQAKANGYQSEDLLDDDIPF